MIAQRAGKIFDQIVDRCYIAVRESGTSHESIIQTMWPGFPIDDLLDIIDFHADEAPLQDEDGVELEVDWNKIRHEFLAGFDKTAN